MVATVDELSPVAAVGNWLLPLNVCVPNGDNNAYDNKFCLTKAVDAISLLFELLSGCVVIIGTLVPPIVACVPVISILLFTAPCKYAWIPWRHDKLVTVLPDISFVLIDITLLLVILCNVNPPLVWNIWVDSPPPCTDTNL